MRTPTLGLLLGALFAAAVLGQAHEAHRKGAAPAGETVTVTGEIVDLSCYLDHGGKGAEHRRCARACLVEKRIPAGLLGDDGSLFLLVADHDHEKAFRPIPGWAAERVTVSGRRISKGGLSAILVSAAEKAK